MTDIKWCRVHHSVSGSEICQMVLNIAYRIGSNPYDKITCKVVKARVTYEEKE